MIKHFLTQLQSPPRVYWDAAADSLYTLIIHNSIGYGGSGNGFVNYLVTNIPGTNIENGTNVAEWVAPFALNINDGELIRDEEGFFQPIVVLVYRQGEGEVEIEGQIGCKEDIVGGFREEVNEVFYLMYLTTVDIDAERS